jgi:hypothetical protein
MVNLAQLAYMSYVLEAPDLQKHFSDNAKVTAPKGIYLQALSETQIPLAPLNEQKRIAEKLDSLLKRVDSCRERLDRVPVILKRFRQAVLAAATSGALTEDWREKNRVDVGRTAFAQILRMAIMPERAHAMRPYRVGKRGKGCRRGGKVYHLQNSSRMAQKMVCTSMFGL